MARLSHRPLFRQRRSFARRFAGAATIALVAAVAVLVVVYLTLPWTTGLALRVFLNRNGWGPAKVDVARLDVRGVKIKDVQIAGSAITLTEVHVDFTPQDLWHGRVRDVAVKGLAVTVTASDDGLMVGSKPFVLPATSSSEAVPFRHLTVTDSKFTLLLPENRIETRFSADLAPADGRWRGEVNAVATARKDNASAGPPIARVTWKGELAWPDITEAVSSGTFDLEANDIVLAKDTMLTGRGHMTFATGGGQLSMTSAERITLNLSAFPWAEGAWVETLKGGIAVQLSGTKGGPTLTWHQENGTATAQADFDFSAVAGDASVRGGVRGRMTGPVGDIPDSVAIDEIRLEGTRVPSPIGTLSGHARVSEVTGPLTTAEGAARIEATASKPELGPLTAASATVNGTARFHIDGATLVFTPQVFTVTAADLHAGAAAIAGPTTLALAGAKGETQSLMAAFGASGELVLTFGLTTGLRDTKIATESLAPVAVDLPRLRLEGYVVPGSGRYDISVRTGSGVISHPSADFQIAPVTARFLPGSGECSGSLQLTRLFGAPTRSSPTPGAIFKYNLQITNHVFDFTGNILSAKSQELGRVKAQFNGADDSGHIEADVPRLTFGEGATAASDVFSGAFPLGEFSGTVNASMKRSWGAKPSSSGRLALDNVAFRSGALSVNGLATDLYLASLTPLRSTSPQRITAALVTAGLPFKDVFVETSFPGDGKVALSGGASVAGGKASLPATSLVLDDVQATPLPLTLSRLRLETLMAQAQVEGLDATGSISGTALLQISGDSIRVENGLIKTDGPGRVTYQPKSPPAALAGSGQIVLQALSNFEYDSISGWVSGDLLKELRLGLTMKGKNPDLYGGYPISFKLNLGGPLGDILRRGVSGYKFDTGSIPELQRNSAPGTNVNPR